MSGAVSLSILFIISIASNEAARILAVYPTPSISHQVVFRPLTNELVKRGHEVVVITTDPAYPKGQAPANLTEIDLHDLSYDIWRKQFVTTAKGNKNDLIAQILVFFEVFNTIFRKQMETNEVQNLIHGGKQFDLLLLEGCVRQASVFSHIYKVPVILISSFGAAFGNYEALGAPTHPFLYRNMLHQKLYNLSLWDKVLLLYNEYWFQRLFYKYEDNISEMLKRMFGPDTPALSTLESNVDMLFLNIHPIWDGNRPVPPGVIYMGGLHQNPEKELPKDLKSYLDSSKNGVIYLSFGTNVNPSLLPPEKIQMIVKVFSQLPYDVLWKWNKDELPGRSENIKIAKWFPQSDLLRHPKIKLFITQGGLQSTDEAITAGVPLIGVPMVGDQWYNVEKYVHHKIGIRLDMETLTEEQFKNAILTIINDKSYRENVVKLRTLMNDQPQRPLDRTVWWTEYVLRHGGARHLRAPAANISWSEFLEFELVAVLLIVLITVLFIFTIFAYSVYKFVSNRVFTFKLKSS